MTSLHFLRPEWLWLLPVAAVLLWLGLRRGGNSSGWSTYCDPALLEAQILRGTQPRQWLPWSVLCAGWLLGIITLAGPSWQQQPVPVYSDLQSRVILFDLSRSMDSNDLSPSRLVRARYKLTDLVDGAGARQQALIVFAGDSFTVSPFTDDRDTLTNLIPALDTGTVPLQGSRADLALDMAAQLIDNAGARAVQVILITDGVNRDSMPLAAALAKDGHTVSVLAVGTAQGAPIALPEGGLLKDSLGNIVVPGVDYDLLRQLVQQGQGQLVDVAADGSDIARFNQPAAPRTAGTTDTKTTVAGSGGTLRWLDGGIWLLLPLTLLASFGFRRGALLVLLVAVAVPDRAAEAFGWDDLWQRPDQRAAAALAADDPDAVPNNAPPTWLGAGAYRLQDYETAIENFSTGESAVDWYNRGNALAKAGQLQDAIAAYDAALARQQDMEDARINRDLVAKLLEQQQQQQQQSGGQSGDRSNDQADDQAGENEEEERSDSAENTAAGPDGEAGERERDQSENPSDGESPQQSHSGDEATAEDDQAQRTELTDEQQQSSEDTAQDASGEANGRSPELLSEDRQALDQWLQQVPDDPGGLLRRKFRYQLGQRPQRAAEEQRW